MDSISAELFTRQEVITIVASIVAAGATAGIGGVVAFIKLVGQIPKMQADINALWACLRAQNEVKREIEK